MVEKIRAVKNLTRILINNWFDAVYLKQINIFIEMVICVAVDCKSDSRQGKAKDFINLHGTKIWSSNGS